MYGTCTVPSKSTGKKQNIQKNEFFVSPWRSMTKIAGSRSGCISHRHGSADPDPNQNGMDPQHCLEHDYYWARISAGRGLRCPAWWRPLRRATPAWRSPTRGTRDASLRLTLRPPSRKSASTGRSRFNRRVARAPDTRVQYLFSRYCYLWSTVPYLSDLSEFKSGLLLRINVFFTNLFREFHPSKNRNRTVFRPGFGSVFLPLFKSKLGQKKLMFVLDPVRTIERKWRPSFSVIPVERYGTHRYFYSLFWYPRNYSVSFKANSHESCLTDFFFSFVAESTARIAAMQTELAKWEAMMPIEEMNM